MRAMPKGEAPVSRDVVEQAKRRVPPKPLGPPPSGMSNFKAPKQYAPMNEERNRYDDDDRNRYDEDEGNNDDGYNRNNRSFDYGDDDRQNRNDRYNEVDDRGYQYNYNRDNNERYDESPEPSPLRNKYERNEFRQNFDEEESGYDNNHHNNYNDNRNNYNNDEDEDQDDAFYDQHAEEYGVAEPKHGNRPGQKAETKQQQGAKPSAASEAKSIPVANANCEALLANLHNTSINNQSPGKIVLYNYQSILRATYRELKHFVTSPCTYGITTRCYIERNRSGSHMFAPYYSICADLEDGTGRELMVCRKIMKSQTAHYIFSLKTDDLFRKREQRSKLYLGKLRAITSNDYVFYDTGICEAPENFLEDGDNEYPEEGLNGDIAPSKGGPARDNTALAKKFTRDAKGQAKGNPDAAASAVDDPSLYRRELVSIHFNTKNRPAPNDMRGTEVCIPRVFPNPDVSTVLANEGLKGLQARNMQLPSNQVFTVQKSFEKIREKGKQNDMLAKSHFIMHERTSKYDPLSSCLVDFKGRANVASVKNCQFVCSDPVNPTDRSSAASAVNSLLVNEQQRLADADKNFLLQLGKTTEDCFNMDFRYPLSLLQAFAICIARFDAKLSW